MDTLQISDIRAYGYTGALPEENVLGQWFRVDLTLQIDLQKAGATDVLADTHDYRGAIAAVHTLIQKQPFKLIESLASEIAKAVLQTDERLSQVTVKLTKLAAPIPDFTGTIAVEIVRDRSHLGQPAPASLSRSA
ncbi:MAG: dihydroneopterin aldolase [Cyanobacteria bacterium P01_F01_bin.86]